MALLMNIRPPPQEPLYEAIFQRDIAAVEALIRNGTTDVSFLRPDGWTPILFAVTCIRRCIYEGTLAASPHAPNPRRRRTAGAPSVLVGGVGGGILPTPSSAAVAILQLLIDAGADVNRVKAGWDSPLRMVVDHSSGTAVELDVARRLIAAGADVCEAGNGYTAPFLLSLAVAKGFDGMVDLLLPHTPITIINASCKHTYETAEGTMATQFLTHLHLAVFLEHAHIVESLLAAGADAETRCSDGLSPLYTAASDNSTRIAKLLIEHGADVNCSETALETPLHAAAEFGGVPLVTLLLDAGADPLRTNGDGESPLYIAAFNSKTAIVRRLLAAGADPNVTDKNGESPLYIAAVNGDAAIVQMLLANGANPNSTTSKGESTLYAAVSSDSSDDDKAIVSLLLAAGADPNNTIGSSTAHSPLHTAVSQNHCDIAKLLLDAKADVDARSFFGLTPLMTAAIGGHKEAAQLLLDRGADPTVGVLDTTSEPAPKARRIEYTALHFATSRKGTGYEGVAKLLLPLSDSMADGTTPSSSCAGALSGSRRSRF